MNLIIFETKKVKPFWNNGVLSLTFITFRGKTTNNGVSIFGNRCACVAMGENSDGRYNEVIWSAIICSLLGRVTVGPLCAIDLLKQGVMLFI